MKKLENLTDIKPPIIPTCNPFENRQRADAAIKFVEKYNLPKKCIISGLGPGKGELDFKHKDLYNYMMEKGFLICLEDTSLNSIENILESFRDGIEGEFPIPSYPLHLMRFKRIVKDAKKAGKISKNVDIIPIPTKQYMRWIPHEIMSNVKYYIKGKRKYFGKSKNE